MGIVREDPIAVSGVNAQIEMFDEKYMDPPVEESTEQERHLHNTPAMKIGNRNGCNRRRQGARIGLLLPPPRLPSVDLRCRLHAALVVDICAAPS